MKVIIELEECLQDSPKFRSALQQNEDDIDQLEQKLEKLIKLCNNMVETGKSFIASKNSFINGIWEMVVYFKEDLPIVSALSKLNQAMTELTKYHSILIDQAQRSVGKNLQNFVKNDIRQAKESKRYFEKIGDDLDNALIRNSQAPRSKTHECEDTSSILAAVRSCFQHTALDYVSQLSCLQSKKRFEILDTFLSLMHAYSTYFHQGWDLFQDVDPFLKHLAGTLADLNDETTKMEKQLDGRHTLVTSKDIVPVLIRDENLSNGIKLEGYLFKRTSNAFKTWNRRWFAIRNNQLVYRKRSNDDIPTIMEEDLRLCSVKIATDIDRRFCFEVLSPTKSHMLQADSEETFQQWVSALQEGIDCAINHVPHEDNDNKWQDEKQETQSNSDSSLSINESKLTAPVKPPRAHSQILSIPGNELCCDCKSPDPRWASINLGITLCIECSGIHRSLGVHVSKVRSLTLDTWEPEILKVMAELGNTIVNRIYEANVDSSVERATPESSRNIREAWIKAKYVKKQFVKPLPGVDSSIVDTNVQGSDTNKIIRNIPQRWSVRKVHRRRRTVSALKKKENQEKSLSDTPKENSSEISNKEPESIITINNKNKEYNNQNSDADDKTLENILIFGETEDVIHSNLDFDSADESPTLDEVEDTLEDISKLHPDLLLYRAAAAHNLPVMCEAFAHGANPNWKNKEDNGKYPLHQAIQSGSIMACEYLLLNSAKCNNQDDNGQTILHLATTFGHTGQVCLLLKRGADQSMLDATGKNALALAMQDANADIVTLLRLAKLNEEIRRDEFGNPGDETFNEVVKDFSHMASHNPEKLRRPPTTAE
ncbi:arf-GAP with coiled-coil, ANK repeat and PH domain-containing protein 2 [Centruroides vittatus]|uniref:arf-GAP with coiled-coil, ANK repeat and PH domain-containing protein 2 n=1 Tax=Centruroides vittatus TaxID=120091 RepID=UPI00350E9FFD